jgi:hypothetical protein
MGSASGSARGGRAEDRAQSGRRREAKRLAGAVFAVLVLASVAAFFLTQRLKHTPTAVQRIEMTPAFRPTRAAAAGCSAPLVPRLVGATERLEYLSFKIAQADEVTVTIIDPAGDQVATIVHDLSLERYKQLSLCWNGHRGPAQRGRLAAPGEYRMQVSLRRQRLTRLSPHSFTLEPRRS